MVTLVMPLARFVETRKLPLADGALALSRRLSPSTSDKELTIKRLRDHQELVAKFFWRPDLKQEKSTVRLSTIFSTERREPGAR